MISLSRQENEYYCGPAVLQAVLGQFSITATQTEIAKIAGTTAETGTSTEGMTRVLEHHGLALDAGERRTPEDIRSALASEKIVIVCWTERHLEEGHYSIVSEVSDEEITLFDPAEESRQTRMSVEEFEKRWRDPLFTKTERWMMAVEIAQHTP